MFKNLLVMLSIVSLSACVTYYPHPQYEPEQPAYTPSYEPPLEPRLDRKHKPEYPHETRERSRYYKISTDQMNRFILAKNNLEYCLLPELGQQRDERLTALEKQLVKEMIHEQLEKIVGKSSARTIYDDPEAYRYFQFKYHQLKHELVNIRESECRHLKENYNKRFKDSKRQRGLDTPSGNSIERRIHEQQQSIEEKIRHQQESIERKIRDQQEAIERKISGRPEPLYQPKKDVSIDWEHPLDRW